MPQPPLNQSPTSVRVVIVDSDFYAREAVATRLQRDPEIRVVGEHTRFDELLVALSNKEIQPHVAWVGLESQPEGWLQRGSDTSPELRWLGCALALQPEHQQLWKQGLAGIVLKHECGDAIGLAICAVAQGQHVITPGVQPMLGKGESGDQAWVLQPSLMPKHLSPHLLRVAYLRYVRQLTPDQIAEELMLSANTVESYLKVIKSALQLDGRANLLTRGFVAMTHGLSCDS